MQKSNPSVGRKHIPRTAHRLQVARLFRIVLKLATQACDLHVHRAFLALSSVATQFLDQLRALSAAPGFAAKIFIS